MLNASFGHLLVFASVKGIFHACAEPGRKLLDVVLGRTNRQHELHAVTIRERDSMAQVRVPIAELKDWFADKFTL